MSEAAQELAALAVEASTCTRCALAETRTQVVFGAGSPTASVMFVGEAPGFHEDQQGIPFVGAAGKLLDRQLDEIGVARDDTYIGNVLKCRPPGNRDPLPEEVAACRDYLNGQIAVINPRVICTLGRPALQTLVDPAASISRVHGVPREQDGLLFVPLYHPAAALHRQDLSPTLVEDMRKLQLILEKALA